MRVIGLVGFENVAGVIGLVGFCRFNGGYRFSGVLYILGGVYV